MFLCTCLLILPCSPLALAQEPAQSLDSLAERLNQRTAQRRQAAAQAWRDGQKAFFNDPNEHRKDQLADFGPEIQDPVLASLKLDLATQNPDTSRIGTEIRLLAASMNASGADRLAMLLSRLPDAERLVAMDAVAEHGGPRSWRALEKRQRSSDQAVRAAALHGLVTHGPVDGCSNWMEVGKPSTLDGSARIGALNQLSKRTLKPEFKLPAAWFQLTDAREQLALLAFLQSHPDPNAEDFVLPLVLDSNRKSEIRKAGLVVLETGCTQLKWRNSKRKLGAILRNKDGDPLADETAWALHRLGEKSGTRFLLAAPEAEVKRNKASWRAHLELGEMEVRLSEFRSGYKSYKIAIQLAEARRGRLSPIDWLYAARAAAGSRKRDDAGNWLARTRMTASELAPYKDLPEFEPYLDKQPFKRLFGR